MIQLKEMRLVYLLHKRSKYMSEFDDIIKRRKMVRQYIGPRIYYSTRFFDKEKVR
jgi:hypothetical protein